jgi:hypothetical protein
MAEDKASRRFLTTGTAACGAAVLIVIGIEISEPLLKHVLEILGALTALLGLVAQLLPAG